MTPLSKPEKEQYQARQVALATVDAKPSAKPRAIILAGQPGSGKSRGPAKAAKAELAKSGDGVVVIDPDQFRARHPRYEDLMLADDRSAAAKTQKDASEAADAVRAAASAQGMNLLIDGTLKSPDKAKKLVEDLVAAGYQVDVVAMCVDPADSWQGVQNRYNDEKAATGSGRWVPKEVHDAAARGMVDSLQQLREQGMVSDITVVNRTGNRIYQCAPAAEATGKPPMPGSIEAMFEANGGRTPTAPGGSATSAGGGAGRPQARISDMHVCPLVTGVVPHVGGPVALGCPTVLVGNMPAARIGDMVTCVGPPDSIVVGSATVLIGGAPAARLGDSCAHGGTIVVGFPTVLTGG